MDKCSDLVPDYFSFVKGIVDSADLSLNISREILQQDYQLKIMAKAIDKKIKNELKKMLNNDRDKYEKFFETFGIQLKWGIYANYGMEKDALKDFILFKSSKENKYVTLKEYVEAIMPAVKVQKKSLCFPKQRLLRKRAMMCFTLRMMLMNSLFRCLWNMTAKNSQISVRMI